LVTQQHVKQGRQQQYYAAHGYKSKAVGVLNQAGALLQMGSLLKATAGQEIRQNAGESRQ
jgi:hypothetical protein